jgi:hypothetical protein
MTDGIRCMFGLGDVMEFASLPARQRYREPIEVEATRTKPGTLTGQFLRLAIRESGRSWLGWSQRGR